MDENGTQTWTLYDGSDAIMDLNSSGSLEMRYLNGPTGQLVDSVLARESAGGIVAWYLPDRLGTIRDLINNSGSIVDHIDFSAFGTVLDQSDPSEGDRMMGFAGMEMDSVTGMNLAVYRVQNPGTGRWTSEDPLGFAGLDTNLLRYTFNSPNEFQDESGEIVWLPIMIIGIGIGAVLASPTNAWAPGPEDHPKSDGFSPTLQMLLYCAGGTLIVRIYSVLNMAGLGSTGASPITPQDIFNNPSLLAGKTPQEIEQQLGSLPPGWVIGTLGRGSRQGQGWTLRQFGPNGQPTGWLVRWHPGGGHHGPHPYWTVACPNSPITKLGPRFPPPAPPAAPQAR
jgi:RHS repeat-associated protein